MHENLFSGRHISYVWILDEPNYDGGEQLVFSCRIPKFSHVCLCDANAENQRIAFDEKIANAIINAIGYRGI